MGLRANSIFSYCKAFFLLALVAQYELNLDQLDVKTAFLHGDLDEEIYMSADRVQDCRKRRHGMLAEEIVVLIKTVS